MTLSHWGTVLALLNGMIGGTILVLPIIGIESGWIMIPIVAILYGLISYFSAYLIIIHLGQANSINQSILNHFKGDHTYSIIYNIFVGFSLFGFLASYFPLIMKQLQGLVGASPALAPLLGILLFTGTIVMKRFHLAEKFLTFGILGVIIYLIFLSWALITAPQGPRTIPPVDKQWTNLSSAMVMGYAIHDFIVQILTKNPNRKDYSKIVLHTFIIGIIIYTFISYGGYAIINRKAAVQNPSTISQYFDSGSWQVVVLEVMYLVNLITMAPQFMIIFKIRVMQIFKIEQNDPSKIEWKEVLFYALTFYTIYLIYNCQMSITTIIQLNGSILGFSYIFFIPIWVHLKCVYYDRNCGQIMNTQIIQNVKCQKITEIEHTDLEKLQQSKQNDEHHSSPDSILNSQKDLIILQLPKTEVKDCQKSCGNPSCQFKYRSKFHKRAELILIITILLIGIVSMLYTLYIMFFNVENIDTLVDAEILEVKLGQHFDLGNSPIGELSP